MAKNKGGRPALPSEAQEKRGTWRDTKRRKDETQARLPEQAAIERPIVDAKTLPTAKLKRIMQTCIPGYDPWADAGECSPDYEAAREAVAFFHCKLTHVKGAKARQPFILEDWEIAIVANLFGWKRLDGTRRYRECLIFVGRKNGKTPLAAGLILYTLFVDKEPGAEIYGAASEYAQATLVFEHARGMVLGYEPFGDLCKIYSGQVKSIQLLSDFSTYRVISADAFSKHGYNTHAFVIDELHTQPNRDLYDTLRTSTAARRQPLGIYITTSDFDREGSICNEVHEYASKVRDGVIDNPYFLPAIWEATLDDDWTDPKTWAKANPNMNVSIPQEYLEAECQKAQDMPASLNAFLRLHLNVRTKQDVRWINKAKWDACVGDVDATALEKQTCYAGLDLATVSDITAFILAFPDGNKVKLLAFYWVPEDTAKQRDKHDRTTYQQWIAQGIIRTTPGDMTDYGFVRRDINEIGNRFGIRKIAVDRLFQGAQLGQELAQDGFDVEAFGQGFYSMAAPTAHFDRLIRAGDLEHGGCPVLNWMASNVSVKIDPTGSMKPDKKKSSEKIDGIVAAIMAVGLCMAHEDKKSVYADRGVIAF